MEWISQIKPPFGTPLNLAHPLARGLVGSWLMNENSGKIVNDSSGQGNNGLCVGMNDPPISTSGWVPGPHGGALAFDGSNDYVDCGIKLKPPQWSISAVFFTFSGNVFRAIFHPSFSNGYSGGWLLYVTSNPGIRCGDGSTYYVNVSSGYNCVSKWCHVVGTFDGSVIRLYADGVYKNSVSAPLLGYMTTAYPALIGISDGVPLLDGIINHISIYNRALSAEEIAYLYAFPYCFYDAGVSAWEYNQQNRNFDHYYRRLMAA